MLLLLVAGIALGSFGLGFLAVKKGLAGKPGLQPNSRGPILGGLSGLAVLIVYRLLNKYGQDIFEPQTLANSTFWAALSLLMVSSVAVQVWQCRRAGGVLLDLGQPRRRFFLMMTAVAVVPAVLLLFAAPGRGIWQTLCSLTMGAGFLRQALSRFQIRERGIATGNGLLKWEKLKSFYWSKRGTVSITTSTMPWSNKFDLQVPVEHVEIIERILMQHTKHSDRTDIVNVIHQHVI